jgi:stearoyl-CoA desaturase (delta-9 desaturase)
MQIVESATGDATINSSPWDRSWYSASGSDVGVFAWIVLIHATALIGLVMYPLPSWSIFLAALGFAFVGGLGTTVAYHRAIAHRSLKLNPWVAGVLTFCAMFNGSGAPASWASRHRHHHATADTMEDVSSPVWGGFWWAHLRWLWQSGPSPMDRYGRDLKRPSYVVWRVLQAPILTLSYLGPLYFGLEAFFWIGAIRLCFALHAQCFVNSICHSEPGIVPGEDSSRNVGWLSLMHMLQGENWHRNHHSRPGWARLGWNWRQPDAGYVVILALEKLGLATDVRDGRARINRGDAADAAALDPAA